MTENVCETNRINPNLEPLVVPIESLKFDPENARKHDRRNLEAIKYSLTKFGQQKPVVAKDGVIIAGNGMVQAARELEWDRVAVIDTDIDDPVLLKAYGIADNRTQELSEFDPDVLAASLTELEVSGLDLGDLGFDASDLNDIFPDDTGDLDDDEIPEPPADPVTEYGDIWVLGKHRVMCGDSTMEEAVLRLLDGAQPFLMVTDPPYGVEYDPAWRKEAGINKNPNKQGKVQNDERFDWTETYQHFPGSVAYVWHAGRHAGELILNLVEADLFPRSQIIWAKDKFALSRGHYHWQHEPCWYAVRKGHKANWIGDRKQSTIWNINRSDDSGHGHGTQKPLECMARPIRNHDAPEVYDPFLGSGTTLIAAEHLGRVCFGMEIDPAYCDVIVTRWQNLTGKKAETTDGKTL